MLKSQELSDPQSCWNRAKDGDWVFVLLQHDIAAPSTIRYWADRRVEMGKNKGDDAQITEARAAAVLMEGSRLGADGYADNMLKVRVAVDKFEHAAALVASGHPQHLIEATRLAYDAVLASRSLAVWCQTQKDGLTAEDSRR